MTRQQAWKLAWPASSASSASSTSSARDTQEFPQLSARKHIFSLAWFPPRSSASSTSSFYRSSSARDLQRSFAQIASLSPVSSVSASVSPARTPPHSSLHTSPRYRLLRHMLGIYIENPCKGLPFLCLVPRCIPAHLMTSLVTHLLTYRQGHLLEPPLVVHLPSHLMVHLFSHHMTFLVNHLLSRVYPWRIYMSCFIGSAGKNTRRRVKGNASFPSSDIAFLPKPRFRPLSKLPFRPLLPLLPHHRVL